MNVHIPLLVLFYFGYVPMWILFCRYVWTGPVMNWLRKRKNNHVYPEWPLNLAMILMGPVGWVILAYQQLESWKYKRDAPRREAERKRVRDEEKQWG